MRDPIQFLGWAKLIHPKGASCLDIGCRNGVFASALARAGYDVLAIDKNTPKNIPAGVKFQQANIETFVPDRLYDLVFARNVLPYTQDPLKSLEKIKGFLSDKGILVVTLFGEDEPWGKAKIVRSTKFDDARAVLKDLEFLHWGTYHEFGPTLTDDVTKLWHIHSFVVRRP